MSDSSASTDVNHDTTNTDDLTIEDAVTRVEEIISTLEEGDVSLTEGKELHEEATELLTLIEDEVSLGDGKLERVDAS